MSLSTIFDAPSSSSKRALPPSAGSPAKRAKTTELNQLGDLLQQLNQASYDKLSDIQLYRLQSGLLDQIKGISTKLSARSLAGFIDHTILKPDTKREAVDKVCKEAIEHKFCSVCVNPCFVKQCAAYLQRTGVKVCTVVGFPLGSNSTTVKAFETKQAIDDGADEIDMVINIGRVKNGDWNYVENDVRAVVRASEGRLVKVILETCLLEPDEIAKASRVCEKAGADFVKTSTGFSKAGATIEAVKVMRQNVSDHIGVKASGGIRDQQKAQDMILAGATRIGASSGVKICRGEVSTSSY